MNLSEFSSHIPNSQPVGDDVAVQALAYDSRQVTPGALFVALRGANSDGHDFIPQAMNAGAVALCVNADCAGWYAARGVPTLIVPDTRLALPTLAAVFYGEPSRSLDLIGITGTNGKTTTTYMAESILRTWGEKTGLIGTVGALINGRSVPLEHTTPESADLQRLFAEMQAQGVQRVVMEVSSQGILAHRTEGCAFDTGVWTNLTQDHLDAHGTMDAYFAEKLRLFTEYPDAFPDKSFTGVINVADEYGRRVAATLEAAGRSVLRYAPADPDADLRAEITEARPDGTDFTVHYRPPAGSPVVFPVVLRMGGLFNVANALAAVGLALQRRVPTGAIKNGLEALTGVPGRFEPVDTGGRGFYIVVDYAHTSDGLENVLTSARTLHPARLICVFGCGGVRDRKKRPLMGHLSVELADLTVITSDNPRTEHPDAIIADILAGIEGGASHPNVIVEADRHLAIQKAVCELARPGDMIVIAGKGHEATQQFADHTIPFDDRQVTREALAQCA